MLFVYGWTFNRTFADRNEVKSWVESSGTYQNLIHEIAIDTNSELSSDAVDPEVFIESAETAFPPRLLKNSFETVLDGFYDWLEGISEDVRFEIDLSSAKEVFIDQLSTKALDRAQNLPRCSSFLESAAGFDVFSASCLPVGINVEEFKAQYRDLIANDTNFFPNSVIKASDIKVGDGNSAKTIGQVAVMVPFWYGLARRATYISFVLFLAATIGIFKLANSKQKALLKITRAFGFTAVTVGIFTVFSNKSTSWLDSIISSNKSGNNFVQNILKPIFEQITTSVSKQTLSLSVVYGLITVALLVGYSVIRRRKKQPQTKKSDNKI